MRDFGDNIGGIKAAWILDAAIAEGLPALPEGNSTISLTQLGSMEEFPIFPHRCGFTQTLQINDQGAIFTKTFSAAIPSDNNVIREFMLRFFARQVTFIIQDHDDQYWLLFDQENPGLASVDFGTGTDPGEGKNHTFTISATHQYPRVNLTFTS